MSSTTAPTPTIKQVRFKEKVRIRRVPTRASIPLALKQELWVSKAEILKQAQLCNRNFGLLGRSSSVEDLSRLYLDGLESSQEKNQRHERMSRAVQSVLHVQTKLCMLRDYKPHPPMDPYEMEAQIALRYSKHSQEAAELARERGWNQMQMQLKLQQRDDNDDEEDDEDQEKEKSKANSRPSILDRLKGTTAARRSPGPMRRASQPIPERQSH